MVDDDPKPLRPLILLRWIPLIPLLASLINIVLRPVRLGKKAPAALASCGRGGVVCLAGYIFWLLPATGVFRDTGLYLDSFGLFSGQALLSGRCPDRGDAAHRHRHRLPDPYLFSRLHGARRGHGAFFRLSQPVYLFHAPAGDGRQSAGAVRRLGRRRSLFLSP